MPFFKTMTFLAGDGHDEAGVPHLLRDHQEGAVSRSAGARAGG